MTVISLPPTEPTERGPVPILVAPKPPRARVLVAPRLGVAIEDETEREQDEHRAEGHITHRARLRDTAHLHLNGAEFRVLRRA